MAQGTGSFEVVRSKSTAGKVMRQMVLEPPVSWCAADAIGAAITLIGNYTWVDTYVEVGASLGTVNGTDGVFVATRVQHGGCSSQNAIGVFFFLFPDAQNYTVAYNLARTKVLTTGHLPAKLPSWNKLMLLVKDNGSPYTKPEVTANYIVRWIKGAKTYYNLTIDFIGILNKNYAVGNMTA
nr:hypothetical protein BaRGS_018451 [Batillaria attramentaria]